MINRIVSIFSYLQRHAAVRRLSLVVLTALLLLLLSRQTYKEDISDFLPLNNKYQTALKVYQDITGANRIFAIFQLADTTQTDPDAVVEAIERFVQETGDRRQELRSERSERSERHISYLAPSHHAPRTSHPRTLAPSSSLPNEGDGVDFDLDMTTQIDLEKFSAVSDFVYKNIPYFLTEADYQRIDSLLSGDRYVAEQMAADKQMLLFPMSGLLAANFQKDPLNLFTPVVAQLQRSQMGANFELYDGYIFSPDLKHAVVMITSPFGPSETENNAQLMSFLRRVAEQTSADGEPSTEVSFIGGPAIAVGNAEQIKHDSLLSVVLAVVLIVALLFAVFRNVRNLLLIVLSIAWGWLFAMGALALVHNNISVIVIGISSIILGIAVNYPLHLIAHLNHTPNVRAALREIVMPLVVGNITTVGAFLALVPLQSVALRDLGLFASFLLIGTILFVLLYLPHLVRVNAHREEKNIFSRLGDFSLENNRAVVWIVLLLTLVFGYFSFQTTFDSNMNHINYMTDRQKADMDYFMHLLAGSQSGSTVYVVASDSTFDGALEKSAEAQSSLQSMQREGLVDGIQHCHQFLSSQVEQARRLDRWNRFVAEHGPALEAAVVQSAAAEGFAQGTFSPFYTLLHTRFAPRSASFFAPLTSAALSANVSIDSLSNQYHVVSQLTTQPEAIEQITETVDHSQPGVFAFDVGSMNSSIANSLSNDFNYIGWACGLIVFFFLWFSLGSIELAMLSFLPMAVSWLWILGIMAILGIQFNVVNVILATFIFGQGDDYTIFMTEGCQYEYAYRRKMLASYKNSIIISAIIMFIGIGTLIVSKHPALHSLAEVTIVGMFSVVLMAYLFPPLIYRWMVSRPDGYRYRPLSLRPLLISAFCATVFFFQLLTVYLLGFILFVVLKPTERRKKCFRSYVRKSFWFDMRHMPGLRFSVQNPSGEDFSKPAVVVCNHQSMLDTAYLMALSDRFIIVANEHASRNRITRQIFQWLDFYTLPPQATLEEKRVEALVSAGYSIVIFPEGERNPHSSILRFHKGAFYLAERFHLDVVPLLLHGVNHVYARNSFIVYPGEVTLQVGQRINADDATWGNSYSERTRNIHLFYKKEYETLRRKKETAAYFHSLIKDRYRYKGLEISSAVGKNLARYGDYVEWVNPTPTAKRLIVLNGGYGEMALLMALVHPSVEVYLTDQDADKLQVARYSAEKIAPNLHFIASDGPSALQDLLADGTPTQLYLMNPTAEEQAYWEAYGPILIR